MKFSDMGPVEKLFNVIYKFIWLALFAIGIYWCMRGMLFIFDLLIDKMHLL